MTGKSQTGNVQKSEDREYRAWQANSDKELREVNKRLDVLRTELSKSGGRDSGGRSQQLRERLEAIRTRQAAIRESKKGIYDQVKVLEESIKKRIKEIQGNKQIKNIDEVDREIAQLSGQVDSGTLRLAEEKRVLAQISTLKRFRKQLGAQREQRAAIDREREQLSELKRQLQDEESASLGAEYGACQAEMGELRAQNEGRSALYEERSQLQQRREELREEKRVRQQEQWERGREQRERAAEEQKQRELSEKLEEAREGAVFVAEIASCEGLIRYFEGRKDKQRRHKFSLPLGVVDELGAINVRVPFSAAEVDCVVRELRERQKHFAEEQKRVTAENVARLEKEFVQLISTE